MAEGCTPKDPKSQAKRPLPTLTLKLGEIQAGETNKLAIQPIEFQKTGIPM